MTPENAERNQTSQFLSLILRHKPQVIGITLDEHGWADVELEKAVPPEYLYHGTGEKFCDDERRKYEY